MKTQKLKKTLLCLLLICSTIYACKKDRNDQKLTAETFKSAGLEHNKNLDKMLAALMTAKKENRLQLTKDRLLTRQNSFTLTNLKQENGSLKERLLMVQNQDNVSPIDVVEGETKQYVIDQQLDQYLTNSLISYTTQVFDGVPLYDDEHLYTSATASNYSNNEKNILAKLNEVVSDDDENLASCVQRIHNIENEVSSLGLSNEEAAKLYISTNTAINSLTYWHDNAQDWINVLSNRSSGDIPTVEVLKDGPKLSRLMRADGNKPKQGFSWKKVGKGDIAGAGAGVVAFGGAALFGGPVSWAAFGASVGGWAAGCSAYEAITQLLN